MNLCKYCGGPAFYPPKTKYSGWCCSIRFYDCLGYKIKTKHTPWNKGKKGLYSAWNKGLPGTFTNKKHSKESKKKISIGMMGNKNCTNRLDRQNYYNGIRMDSKWEISTARYLDNNLIQWKYSERGYKLSDGRIYYPDFFIYENLELIKLIEVKGYFRPENKEKFNLFTNSYPDINIEIWDRKILIKLGIINISGYAI